MLVLILGFLNGPQPAPDTGPFPSASPPAHARAVSSLGDAVGGAWAGEWAAEAGRAPIGMEAAFRPGAAATVFAYFTFIERGVRRTVLRQGVSAADRLWFPWPGGRRLELRLTDADRLQGELLAVRGDGGAGTPAGSMSLSRLPR